MTFLQNLLSLDLIRTPKGIVGMASRSIHSVAPDSADLLARPYRSCFTFRPLLAAVFLLMGLLLSACSGNARKQADELFASTDYAGAAKAYAPLASNAGAAPEVRRNYALSLARSGKAAEAEPLLAQLEQTAPDPEVLAARIDCVALIKGIEEARTLAAAAAQKYPDAAPIQRALGTLAAQRGDLTGARKYLERALAVDPKDGAALANLGDLHLRERDIIGAMERYSRAISAEPRSPMSVRVRVRMSQILAESNAAQAMSILQDAVLIDPDAPEVLAEMGKIMATQGLFDECIQYLKEAYEAKLERTDVLSTLGFCFLQRGLIQPDVGAQRQDLLAAQMWFNRLLAKEPAYRGAHNNLGKVLAKLGDSEQAEEAFRKELALYPGSVEAYTNLGRYLNEQGQTDRALEMLTRAFELDRRQVVLAAELGRLTMLQGDEDAAFNWFMTANSLCQGSPGDHPCRIDVPFQLARIAARRKDRETAVRFFLLSVEAGFRDVNRFKAEGDLRLIHTDPRVAQFLANIPQ